MSEGSGGGARRQGRSRADMQPWRQVSGGLLLLLVAAGLGLYAWLTRPQEQTSTEPEPERVVWDAGDSAVREVVLEQGGQRVVLRPGPPGDFVDSPEMPFGGQGAPAAQAVGGLLAPDRWWVHSPGPFPAAEEYAGRLDQQLRKLVADRLVVPEAADLAQYGLDEPKARVTVRFQDGQERVLELGGSSPVTDGGVYARLQDGQRVWLLPKALGDVLQLPADQWRETLFLPFADERVQRVELVWNGERLTFQRQETGTSWTMERNGQAVGTQDESNLSELWFGLHQWRAERFVADDARDRQTLARYGLDRPFGQIRLEFERPEGADRTPQLIILVGAPTESGGRYVTTNEGPWVYALDPDDLKYFTDEVLPPLRQPAGQEEEGSQPSQDQDQSNGETGTGENGGNP